MLQRAASNAYSWWWASHIRTKQSKWLEQCLQDMDEQVQSMLTIIEGDGDSFAKRVDMYYRRRPELISSVEEAYKAFRSLADRYDLLSKELQNANHTIATVFPEQVQLAMAEDEDNPSPKIPLQRINNAKVPQVPKAPIKELRNIITKASKQLQVKKTSKAKKVVVKSGLTKDEALEEISKLQKEILALQTVKEFVKSSYESGLAKYWGIENQIMEMQQKVSRLQDEFNMESVIEDDEARTLMAEAALKSCQETLALLQEKQEKSTQEAREEYKRIEAACQRLESIRQKYMLEKSGDENRNESENVGDESKNFSKDVDDLIQEAKEFEEKSEETFDLSSLGSLTVSQLAEKIDQLVNKVINLETAVSSQTVLVNTLRSETDDLSSEIRNLEDENENLIDDQGSLTTRVRKMEEKLDKVQHLNKTVERQNSNLETNFAKAHTSLGHLSEKLSCVMADEEVEARRSVDRTESLSSVKADEEMETHTGVDRTENSSSVKADKELEAHTNVGRVSEKLSSLMADEEMDTRSGVDHMENSSSVKADEEVQSCTNTVCVSEKLSSPLADEEMDSRSVVDRMENSSSVKADSDVETCTNTVCVLEKLSSLMADDKVETSVKADNEIKKTGTSHQENLDDKSFNASKMVDTEDVKEVEVDVQGSDQSVHKRDETEKVIGKTGSFLDRKHDDHHSDTSANGEGQGKVEKDEELNWQQILLSGMEDKEKILLKEYTTILRNYKDVKKKLNEVEKKERDAQFDTTLQMRRLKEAILKRDDEISSLRLRLNSQPLSSYIQPEAENDDTDVRDVNNTNIATTNEDDKSKWIYIDRSQSMSGVEEKLRTDIDAILDENLDFWLRFSTAFHQVQKFKTEVKDLQDEILNIEKKRKPDGTFSVQIKSEIIPIYKHLREIQRELTVWLEQSGSLKDELKNRLASLCNIQEDITKALKEGVEEDEIKFSSHQAAKLQGEIMNMKHENNKVREELQAALDHITVLQLQVEKTLRKLNQEYGIDQPDNLVRARVPLRSFIFGTKPKKQKNSIFSCMHPARRYHILRAGIRLSSHHSHSN